MGMSLVDLLQKLSITQYSIGSEHWVDVTCIADPSNFYVRPTAYKDYLLSLEAPHPEPVDAGQLQLGSIVLFKSKTTKSQVRGEIRNINDERTVFDMFALDYGFIEQFVNIRNIKKPRDNCLMPPLVVQCQLADCEPKTNMFDERAIEAMIFYVGNERAKMVVKGRTGDKYIVELINSCPENIATMMALTGYTCIGYGNNAISRMPTIDQPKLYYTYKKLKIGDTLNVRLQSGDSLKSFYVCEVQDHKQYNNELKDLKYYINKEQDFLPENLKTGKAVAVFSDRFTRYDRAIITDVVIPEKKAVAQLVDWGTKMDINMDATRLKSMSREYYFLRPAMAIYCMAEEKQVWDNKLHRFLYPGYEFVITIKQAGHQLHTPNIVTISEATAK